MFHWIKLLFSFALVLLIISCSPKHSEIIVAEYGKDEIKMDEFEKAYSKNVGGYEAAKDDSFHNYKNFADLYVNFKMKLRDAEVRGYDKDETLMNELMDYKKKVGSSYIIEKYMIEPNIKEMYERRKTEIRASHLMIRPEQNGGDEAAKDLAQKILDSIKTGRSFEEMVRTHSQDQFSKPKDGDIFYFTAGQLPYEFEDACYKIKAGEVYPEVVKTRFGYHIIKVTDVKQRIPKIRAAHILISFMKNDGTVDTLAAKQTMDTVVTKLKAGEEFEKLASEYSDDTGTKNSGGDLGFFERRMMVQAFDETAFNLEVGQISDVVETSFGYHVIKLLEKQAMPTLEEDKENLKNIFKRIRYNDVYSAYLEDLKEEFNYRMNDYTLQKAVENCDSTLIGTDYPKMDVMGNEEVYVYSSNRESFKSFYDRLKTDTEFTGKKYDTEILKKAVDKYANEKLLEQKAMGLDSTDAQFAELMNDYKNGIFIFKLQEDEVWNKVKLDSLKLLEFYEQTKENYTWPDRVSYSEIFAKKDSVIKFYYSELQAGVPFDSLTGLTERIGFKEKRGKYDFQAVGSTEFSKKVNELVNEGDYSEIIQNPGGYSILRLDKRDLARLKTFEEAKAEVSGAFQEAESKRLEKEYLESLKKKYEPVIFYDELQNAFQPEGK